MFLNLYKKLFTYNPLQTVIPNALPKYYKDSPKSNLNAVIFLKRYFDRLTPAVFGKNQA